MQSIDGCRFRFGNDLQVLPHTGIEGALTGLCLGLIAPYSGDGDDVFDGSALDDAGG